MYGHISSKKKKKSFNEFCPEWPYLEKVTKQLLLKHIRFD